MDQERKNENSRSEKAVDRNGYRRSEPNRMSRVKPLRSAEGALDILFGSEPFVAVAIDGAARSGEQAKKESCARIRSGNM
jgi:hypothetical protein